MAVNQKLSEIGWFYHAPEPASKGDRMDIPLTSQIPGLNDLSSIPYDDAPRSLFKDSDTKYVRLAKKGGRSDLLVMHDPKPKSKEPAAYPKNDWFYLEDNRIEMEHTEPTKPWEFRLPEYMVHDEHKPFGEQYDYKNDPDGKIYWRKGRVPPGTKEIKHPSRAQDIAYQPSSAPPSMVNSAPARQAETQQSRYPPVPQLYDLDARPAMNKLLAYGYATEWQGVRDQWYRELNSNQSNGVAMEQKISESAKPTKNTMTWTDVSQKKNQPANASKRIVPSNDHEKPMFKISKFEKVGPKVSSHRPLPPIQSGK